MYFAVGVASYVLPPVPKVSTAHRACLAASSCWTEYVERSNISAPFSGTCRVLIRHRRRRKEYNPGRIVPQLKRTPGKFGAGMCLEFVVLATRLLAVREDSSTWKPT